MSGRRVHRLNDSNTAGGSITTIPQGTVFANGLPVSVNGSRGTADASCPLTPHCSGEWYTAQGRYTVYAQNIRVNCEGDSDSCGHSRASGSPNVFAEDISYGMAIIDST